MLDFREISKTGTDFECMVRELLFRLGYHVKWSGKGPDSGKDLLCKEIFQSRFSEASRLWLVQCKHNAHSGKAVPPSALDNDIENLCAQFKADGYLLACSTYPTVKTVERLNGISHNGRGNIKTAHWDSAHLERLLDSPQTWGVAQTFMPRSTNATGWRVYHTDRPNHWIVVNKSLYVHIHNRIGSDTVAQFSVVRSRLEELGRIKLPKKHSFALRAIYHDDKNGSYTWYLDYMRPVGEKAATTEKDVQKVLQEGYAYTDGQCYHFDVLSVEYNEYSDHYDRNHYNYYTAHMGDFMTGGERRKN